MKYRWTPQEGQRHAVPADLSRDLPGETLCGDTYVPHQRSMWQEKNVWPTCWDCDGIWRENEGILPWPRKS
ncbi:zinc finger protein [Lentzea sp. NPDC058450]|uniref:zinc finger protein n=1 Tax=Lentzea sp. NPDC058450 TaxID=3346505 RepID=UPI00365610EA